MSIDARDFALVLASSSLPVVPSKNERSSRLAAEGMKSTIV
jgi:hypothetical protein